MEQIYIKEANSEVEVHIYLDKHMGDKLNALKEAARIIQREVIRVESGSFNRNNDRH